MESAQRFDRGDSGAQPQMVEIGEQKLGSGCFELLRQQALDGAARRHRHEGRGLDDAMLEVKTAEARSTVAGKDLEVQALEVAG
jgi:hypothetical protein